jgi:hypothetical protein
MNNRKREENKIFGVGATMEGEFWNTWSVFGIILELKSEVVSPEE